MAALVRDGDVADADQPQPAAHRRTLDARHDDLWRLVHRPQQIVQLRADACAVLRGRAHVAQIAARAEGLARRAQNHHAHVTVRVVTQRGKAAQQFLRPSPGSWRCAPRAGSA